MTNLTVARHFAETINIPICMRDGSRRVHNVSFCVVTWEWSVFENNFYPYGRFKSFQEYCSWYFTLDRDKTAGSLLLESNRATGNMSETSAFGTSSLKCQRPIDVIMCPSCPPIAFSHCLPLSMTERSRRLGKTYSPCSSYRLFACSSTDLSRVICKVTKNNQKQKYIDTSCILRLGRSAQLELYWVYIEVLPRRQTTGQQFPTILLECHYLEAVELTDFLDPSSSGNWGQDPPVGKHESTNHSITPFWACSEHFRHTALSNSFLAAEVEGEEVMQLLNHQAMTTNTASKEWNDFTSGNQGLIWGGQSKLRTSGLGQTSYLLNSSTQGRQF